MPMWRKRASCSTVAAHSKVLVVQLLGEFVMLTKNDGLRCMPSGTWTLMRLKE
jgi:hypothetical protein